jgi:DNA-3-methyladenine glycosylase II
MATVVKEPGRVRPTFQQGAVELAARDPVIAALVETVGLPKLRRPHDSAFAALVRSILYQQLAGAAALAIHTRLVAAMTDPDNPEALLRLSPEELRAVGLSKNKTDSLLDLARKVKDGSVDLDRRRLARLSDDEIIAHLTSVRGIGRWTAQMFLMFQLRRTDVWPAGDFGVRRGYGLAWKVPMPSEKELVPLGDRFRPYRSVAAWYCWRAAELYANAAESALTR